MASLPFGDTNCSIHRSITSIRKRSHPEFGTGGRRRCLKDRNFNGVWSFPPGGRLQTPLIQIVVASLYQSDGYYLVIMKIQMR